MKIADVKIQAFKRDIPIPEGIDLSHEGVSFMDSLAEIPVVRIFTDEGIEGSGFSSFAASGEAMAMYIASLTPLLVGCLVPRYSNSQTPTKNPSLNGKHNLDEE